MEANDFHPNIKLVTKIEKCVNFLDVRIENKNGIISSSVYHKDAADDRTFRDDTLRLSLY
jgi:hypothetical protein